MKSPLELFEFGEIQLIGLHSVEDILFGFVVPHIVKLSHGLLESLISQIQKCQMDFCYMMHDLSKKSYFDQCSQHLSKRDFDYCP